MSDEVTRQAAEALAERNVSRDDYDWMVCDRDAWQQQAEALGGAAQQMTAALHRLTAERDAALADLEKVRKERDIANLKVSVRFCPPSRSDVNLLQEERDALDRDRERFQEEVSTLRTERDAAVAENKSLLAANLIIRAERDVAERERTESRAEVVQLRAERDAAIQTHVAEKRLLIFERNAAKREGREADAADAADFLRMVGQRDAARAESDVLRAQLMEENAAKGVIVRERDTTLADLEAMTTERDTANLAAEISFRNLQAVIKERDAALAEVEGLRADQVAHPPELHQELAIERKRHLELLDDYNLQATMIETLQEALKRTEASLKAAQMHDIDPRLKGFLANISQLADQSQDLLP